MSQGATGLATEKAPSLSLPVKYLVTAVFFFALFHTLLFIARDQLLFGHFVYPMLRAATHSATLGWLTMMIMGAMYQLVPVVLQESIFSETLGHWGFWSYAAGVSALIAGFAAGALPFLILGGSLATVSIYIFIYNLARTLARVAEWNITGVYLSAALAYLFITVAAGMLLALNLQFGFLSNMGIGINFLAVHATAGGIGWFAMTAVGVGYKLVPMFALVHGHDERLGRAIFLLLNLAVLGTALGVLAGFRPAVLAFLGVGVIGAFLYVWDLRLLMARRNRKILDLTLRHAVVAAAYLVLTAVALFLVAAFPGAASGTATGATPLISGTAYLALAGWLSIFVAGMLYKITPFLVWYHRYASKVGLEPVPLLKDMYSTGMASAAFTFYNIGVVGVALVLFISPFTATAGGDPGSGAAQAATLLLGLFQGLAALATYLLAVNVYRIFLK